MAKAEQTSTRTDNRESIVITGEEVVVSNLWRWKLIYPTRLAEVAERRISSSIEDVGNQFRVLRRESICAPHAFLLVLAQGGRARRSFTADSWQ